MQALLEAAAFNFESAKVAAKAGAQRIELCAGADEGGITPATATIITAKQELGCPFFVMIRPRGGGFVYTAHEVATMKASLQEAKEAGADGFVFGVLTVHGMVDEAVNTELVALAAPLPCTFHRAFDEILDKEEALETLIRCGFRRVLTSGGEGRAVEFADSLCALVAQAGNRIIILPGGGIRSTNIGGLHNSIHASEYHSAALLNGAAVADYNEVSNLLAALQ